MGAGLENAGLSCDNREYGEKEKDMPVLDVAANAGIE